MNRAQVYSAGNPLPDPERIEALHAAPQTSPVPVVTVRRWRAHQQRHDVLHHGGFSLEHMKVLAGVEQVDDGRATRWAA